MIGALPVGLTGPESPSRGGGAASILILVPSYVKEPSSFLLPLSPQPPLSLTHPVSLEQSDPRRRRLAAGPFTFYSGDSAGGSVWAFCGVTGHETGP